MKRDWQKEFYDPAVKGSLAVILAAAKSSSVQRVVIVSSVGALDAKGGATVAGGKPDRDPIRGRHSAWRLRQPAVYVGCLYLSFRTRALKPR